MQTAFHFTPAKATPYTPALNAFLKIPFHARTENDCIDIALIHPEAFTEMILANRTPKVLLAALSIEPDLSIHLCPADILQDGAENLRSFLVQNNCSLRLSCYDALESKNDADGSLSCLDQTAYEVCR